MPKPPLQNILTLDEEWFADHPFSNFFYRPFVPAEYASMGIHDDGNWWCHVSRMTDGTIVHIPFAREES